VRSAYEEQDEVKTLVASTQEKFRQIGNKEVKTRQTFKEALLAKLDRMENNEPDADIT
jgi:predicted RNA-binding protein with PIN domain